MAEWAFGKNGAEHELGGLATGIVKSHRKFATDDFLLLHILVLGERGVLHHIGEDFDGLRGAVRGNIDPINGAVEGGVGIDVAAELLDLVGNRAGRPLFGALEKHVLENVRHPCPHPIGFVDTPRAAPGLDAGHRRAPILLDDKSQAVFVGENFGSGFG